MENDHKTRLHATIDGRVQGVGFRAFVIDRVHSLNLTGWVRNTWDGKVEVLAEGTRQDLDRLLQDLHRGPRTAYVTDLQADWEPATGEFNSFTVRSTV